MNKNMDVYTLHRFDAYIGHYLSFGSFLGSYKTAFDILVKSVIESGSRVDTICYPVLYIMRHCLELGFKTNIRFFLKYSEKEDFKKANTHNLVDLFTAFKLHFNSTILSLKNKYDIEVEEDVIEEINQYCDDLESLVDIFHTLDKNSDSFRYPVDKENNKSFDKKEIINILEVQQAFEKVMTLFFHTADVLEKYIDFADEMEKMYEEEMRAYY